MHPVFDGLDLFFWNLFYVCADVSDNRFLAKGFGGNFEWCAVVVRWFWTTARTNSAITNRRRN
jgi:hypothetical protein